MADDTQDLPVSPELPAPAPAPDAPADAAASSGLTFTPDQLDALGMTDCQPGDERTITVKCVSCDETGCKVDVVDNGAGAEGEAEAPELEDSPDELGSFSRKPKAPPAGLPDTKKMREI